MEMDAGPTSLSGGSPPVFERLGGMMSIAKPEKLFRREEGEHNEEVNKQVAKEHFDKAIVRNRMGNVVKGIIDETRSIHKPDSEFIQRAVDWHASRIQVAQLLNSTRYQAFVGVIVLFNLGLIILETNLRAHCYPQWALDVEACPHTHHEAWIVVLNIVLMSVYSLELVATAYVERVNFWRSKWNWLDVVIVLSGWLSAFLESSSISVAWLRVLRVGRLSRGVKVLVNLRELYVLLMGIATSAKAIFYGTLLLAFMLALWSILLVEFVHPLNSTLSFDGCERCARGFASVENSMLTLFQTVVAGDSWGLIAVQVIEENPATALVLIPSLLTVSLGIVNLILAVIVDSAADARQKDMEERMKDAATEKQQAKRGLLSIGAAIDKDRNGTISFDEMCMAWDEIKEFRHLLLKMEVTDRDLDKIWCCLDQDADGKVFYSEFVEQIYSMQTCDTRVMLTMHHHEITKLNKDISQKLETISRSLHSLSQRVQALDPLSKSFPEAPAGRKPEHPEIRYPSEMSSNLPKRPLHEDSSHWRSADAELLGQDLEDERFAAQGFAEDCADRDSSGGAPRAFDDDGLESALEALESDILRRARSQLASLRSSIAGWTNSDLETSREARQREIWRSFPSMACDLGLAVGEESGRSSLEGLARVLDALAGASTPPEPHKVDALGGGRHRTPPQPVPIAEPGNDEADSGGCGPATWPGAGAGELRSVL